MKSPAQNQILCVLYSIYLTVLRSSSWRCAVMIKRPQLRVELLYHWLGEQSILYQATQLFFPSQLALQGFFFFGFKRSSTSKSVYRSWGIKLHIRKNISRLLCPEGASKWSQRFHGMWIRWALIKEETSYICEPDLHVTLTSSHVSAFLRIWYDCIMIWHHAADVVPKWDHPGVVSVLRFTTDGVVRG